jgi:hypothetical protein
MGFTTTTSFGSYIQINTYSGFEPSVQVAPARRAVCNLPRSPRSTPAAGYKPALRQNT